MMASEQALDDQVDLTGDRTEVNPKRGKSGWRGETWNPVTGCTKISPACDRCFAERIALRLHRDGQARYKNAFNLTLQDDLLTKPLRWREPRSIFLSSMSDVFHKDVPDEYLVEMFRTMNAAHWHLFHVLTKRAKRLARIAPKLRWTSNIWMGVTAESQEYTWRINHLQEVPASHRFVSMQPLLGPVHDLPLERIDFLWTGGERGYGARRPRVEWVRLVRDHCVEAGVPFSFGGWGVDFNDEKDDQAEDRLLDGRTWSQKPRYPPLREDLQLTAF
ncbi:MAG: DUF5131 family protein [Candidatus Poribacteria bacterium]|nr:DUF5131 family protein [Candidatus Poribacteria bacterium]